MSDDVVIIGGGLAAQRCAETLRARGSDAAITIVCGETERPYDRPPLSKGLLAGTAAEPELPFRDPDWYEDNEVELMVGRRAVELDPGAREVALDDGRRLGYRELVVATGSAPRRLPALERFANVHYLRTLADARSLRAELRPGARLVVIGAGFIGQELAATARGLGVEVAVVEALDAPLLGVLGERVGRWFAELHASEGVRMHLASPVAAGHGNGTVEELELAGGERIDADLVVIGVGVEPAAGWLAGSGLGSDGVLTDAVGRTAIPAVYAAGDVSRAFDPRVGAHVRGEHWDGASREGVAVACAILGDDPQAAPVPSFWSDQYRLRIQYVGHAAGADRVDLEGEPDERDFAAVFRRAGRPVAALTVGRPRRLVALRRLIETSHEGHDEKEKPDDLPADD